MMAVMAAMRLLGQRLQRLLGARYVAALQRLADLAQSLREWRIGIEIGPCPPLCN